MHITTSSKEKILQGFLLKAKVKNDKYNIDEAQCTKYNIYIINVQQRFVQLIKSEPRKVLPIHNICFT